MTCCLRALQLIPTHVGKFYSWGEMSHAAGQETKASERRGFIACFVERLQPKADAEEIHAARDGFAERLAQIMHIQSGDESTTVANAGQDEALGFGDRFRPIGGEYLRTQAAQRPFDRGDIACSVIEQGDVHSNSLVLGSTLRRRLSRETAKRSARAKALNSASTWWWEERP